MVTSFIPSSNSAIGSILMSAGNNDKSPNSKASNTSPANPTPKMRQAPRPVFLSGAIQRALQQPWPRRLRTLREITSVVLTELSWWLRNGIRYILPTLRNARRRVTVPLQPGIRTPHLDVYAAPKDADLLPALLSDARLSYLRGELERPVLLYVHGGAWGAGSAFEYASLAAALVKSANVSVIVLDYRLYPVAQIAQQADDVSAALQHLRTRLPLARLLVLAHSSGGQVTALALMRRALAGLHSLVDVAVLTSAPLHLAHHFLFESRRGVAPISPLLPGADADLDIANFDKDSPTVLAEMCQLVLKETNIPHMPPFLEGDIAASNMPLPPVDYSDEKGVSEAISFPQVFLMASSQDSVVPVYSSVRFACALRRVGLNVRLLVYDGVPHTAFVSDWFDRRNEESAADILDVDGRDEARRLDCVAHLHGMGAVALFTNRERSRGGAAHIRDVLRILESLSPSD